MLGRICGDKGGHVLDKLSVWCLGDYQGEGLTGSWIRKQFHFITHQQPKGAELLIAEKPAPSSNTTLLVLRLKSLESPWTFLSHPTSYPSAKYNGSTFKIYAESGHYPEPTLLHLLPGLSLLFPSSHSSLST